MSNPDGLDIMVNDLFEAEIGGSYIPMNEVSQSGGGGQTRTSIGLGLYVEPVPTPSAVAGLIGLVVMGLFAVYRRKRKTA